MKKISLLVILLIAAFQLKAQQVFKLKPLDSLSNGLGNHFKIKPAPELVFKNPGFEWKQTPLIANATGVFLNKEDAVDNMPITLFAGRDDMAVIKTRGYDRMPVLDLRKGSPIHVPQNDLQTAPTFLTPGGQK